MDDEYDPIADEAKPSPATAGASSSSSHSHQQHNHHHVKFVQSAPAIHALPSSVDDELDDYGIVTTVDLSLIRNASANALKALVAVERDRHKDPVPVTKENCLRVRENSLNLC